MPSAYVAARWHDWELAREVQNILRTLGYRIPIDWTLAAELDILGDRAEKPDVTAWARIAEEEIDAGPDADLLVVVCKDKMEDAIGCWLEAGAAMHARTKVHILGPPRNSVFWALPWVSTFADVDEWVGVICQKAA